jgi:hypothetical protein
LSTTLLSTTFSSVTTPISQIVQTNVDARSVSTLSRLPQSMSNGVAVALSTNPSQQAVVRIMTRTLMVFTGGSITSFQALLSLAENPENHAVQKNLGRTKTV